MSESTTNDGQRGDENNRMDYSNILATLQDSGWSSSQESTVLEPYTYLSSSPGKEIRSLLVDAFNLWLKVPPEELEVVKRVTRMLHNASLLMDDVEDNSELRRGLPVAHAIYGVPQTINTANYVYFQAMQALLELSAKPSQSGSSKRAGKAQGAVKGKGKESEEQALMRMVVDELLNLHRGQGLDLYWRDSLTCPTEEEYVHMVLGKTGGLFRLAVKLMMARSENQTDYVPLVNLISIFFQIRDDYMNLQSAEYEDNKGFAEDLTEGKFSFPVVHGVRADMGDRRILNVLQKKTSSLSLKRHTVEYLRNHTKSFAYTLEVLKKLEKQVQDEVKRLGGNAMLEEILKKLDIP